MDTLQSFVFPQIGGIQQEEEEEGEFLFNKTVLHPTSVVRCKCPECRVA
jgi:hypothetical protein